MKAKYEKKDSYEKEPKQLRVYVDSCGWGTLTSFNEKGEGYIAFDDMGGQIVRNWDHFMNMVSVFESEED